MSKATLVDALPTFRSTRLTHFPGSVTKPDLVTNQASFRIVGTPSLGIILGGGACAY